jgi:hypothetical protein
MILVEYAGFKEKSCHIQIYMITQDSFESIYYGFEKFDENTKLRIPRKEKLNLGIWPSAIYSSNCQTASRL